MIKAENSPKIPKNPRIFPKNSEISGKILKTLKICRRAKLGGWGVFLKKILQGEFGYTPLAHLCQRCLKGGIPKTHLGSKIFKKTLPRKILTLPQHSVPAGSTRPSPELYSIRIISLI